MAYLTKIMEIFVPNYFGEHIGVELRYDITIFPNNTNAPRKRGIQIYPKLLLFLYGFFQRAGELVGARRAFAAAIVAF